MRRELPRAGALHLGRPGGGRAEKSSTTQSSTHQFKEAMRDGTQDGDAFSNRRLRAGGAAVASAGTVHCGGGWNLGEEVRFARVTLTISTSAMEAVYRQDPATGRHARRRIVSLPFSLPGKPPTGEATRHAAGKDAHFYVGRYRCTFRETGEGLVYEVSSTSPNAPTVCIRGATRTASRSWRLCCAVQKRAPDAAPDDRQRHRIRSQGRPHVRHLRFVAYGKRRNVRLGPVSAAAAEAALPSPT